MGLRVPTAVNVNPKLKLVMVSDTGSRLQRSWTTFVLPVHTKNPIRVEFNGVSGLDQTHRQESDLGPIYGELTVNS